MPRITPVQVDEWVEYRIKEIAELDFLDLQIQHLTAGNNDVEVVNAEHKIRDLIKAQKDLIYKRVREMKATMKKLAIDKQKM